MWFTQVLAGANDPKRSRINLTTPDYVRTVSKIKGVEGMFTALGFTSTGGYWVFNPSFKAKLEKGLEIVNLEHSKLIPARVAYNPSLPWKPMDRSQSIGDSSPADTASPQQHQPKPELIKAASESDLEVTSLPKPPSETELNPSELDSSAVN